MLRSFLILKTLSCGRYPGARPGSFPASIDYHLFIQYHIRLSSMLFSSGLLLLDPRLWSYVSELLRNTGSSSDRSNCFCGFSSFSNLIVGVYFWQLNHSGCPCRSDFWGRCFCPVGLCRPASSRHRRFCSGTLTHYFCYSHSWWSALQDLVYDGRRAGQCRPGQGAWLPMSSACLLLAKIWRYQTIPDLSIQTWSKSNFLSRETPESSFPRDRLALAFAWIFLSCVYSSWHFSISLFWAACYCECYDDFATHCNHHLSVFSRDCWAPVENNWIWYYWSVDCRFPSYLFSFSYSNLSKS